MPSLMEAYLHADVLELSNCTMCVRVKHVRVCVCVHGLWHPISSLPSKEVRENVLPHQEGGEKDVREAEDIGFALHLSHNPPLLLHYR